jgi:adenine-specific DNA-methyltransferase
LITARPRSLEDPNPRRPDEELPETLDTEYPDGLLVAGDAATAVRALARGGSLVRPLDSCVKLCYLDPPFATGERFSHFPDPRNVSKWKESILKVLLEIRGTLSADGSVWFHIGDDVQHLARCLLDEVLGPQAFVGTIIWQKRTTRENRTAFSSMHDYIHVYAPLGSIRWKRIRHGLVDRGRFSNPDDDPRGPWRSVPLSAQAGHATDAQYYEVVSPAGVSHSPPAGRCWTYSEARFRELIADGRVYWPRNGHGKPRLKRYQSDGGELAPFTIWSGTEVGDNASAKKALLAEFPTLAPFDTPKPVGLMQRIIEIATDPGDLVLDCFLGSGTTAVAAIATRRRWIGIERSQRALNEFALPRIKRASTDNAAHLIMAEVPSSDAFGGDTQLRVLSGDERSARDEAHSRSVSTRTTRWRLNGH